MARDPAVASDRAVAGDDPAVLAANDPLQRLTPREREVLGLVREGMASKEIARKLGISSATARCHVQNVLTKLGVYSRLQAAALAGASAGAGAGAGGDRGGGGDGGTEMNAPHLAQLRTLTHRETQVLRALVGGIERKEIADRLYVSPHTVRTHIQRVLAKLGVHSVIGAMAVARRAGLAPL